MKCVIPFVGAGAMLWAGGDLHAAGREAFLDLTGTDVPVFAAEMAGIVVDEAKREVDEGAAHDKNTLKYSMKPAWHRDSKKVYENGKWTE